MEQSEKELQSLNHRGLFHTPKTAEDFIPYNDPAQPGSYLISMITCAHNLYKNRFHRFESATFSFGQHGGDDTIQWKGVIKESSIIIHPKYIKHQAFDLAKNWDVALAQVVITGKKNIKKFRLCMERLEDKAIQFPWITGKEQELVEYWIWDGLEETA